MLNALAQLNSDLRDITDFDSVVSKLGENVRHMLRTDWVGVVLPSNRSRFTTTLVD
jgi:hypothetical protein